MPFGQYKGCDVQEIPTEYLKWAEKRDLAYPFEIITAELDRRNVQRERRTETVVIRRVEMDFVRLTTGIPYTNPEGQGVLF